MQMHQIHTTADLLRTAADALRHDDNPNRLLELQQINRNWMQTDEERDATNEMLEAMIEAQGRMVD